MGESRKWDVRGPWPWRARLTAPRVSHARAEEDAADAADVSRVPADALHSVEADTFWCVSRLLDGIQVSARGGRGRGLLLGQPTPPGCPARGGVSCDWGGAGQGAGRAGSARRVWCRRFPPPCSVACDSERCWHRVCAVTSPVTGRAGRPGIWVLHGPHCAWPQGEAGRREAAACGWGSAGFLVPWV